MMTNGTAKVPITFSWFGKAERVDVRGSFNDWSPLPLSYNRDQAGFHTSVPLPPGRYLFKYVLNGETWRCRGDLPISLDPNPNNVLYVEKPANQPAKRRRHRKPKRKRVATPPASPPPATASGFDEYDSPTDWDALHYSVVERPSFLPPLHAPALPRPNGLPQKLRNVVDLVSGYLELPTELHDEPHQDTITKCIQMALKDFFHMERKNPLIQQAIRQRNYHLMRTQQSYATPT